jgi:16S rRNA (cytosine967-C5)-methyltransferase
MPERPGPNAPGARRPARPRGPAGGAPAGGGGVTPARAAAAEVLADLRAGHLLDPAFERHAAALDGRDRRWMQELVYGLLRRRAWVDAVLEGRVRGGLVTLDADLIDLLRLGVQQLVAMGSVPAYAAINQTVELAKRRHGRGAGSLANAVLRRVDRERGPDGAGLDPAEPADALEALALRHSHPAWLVGRWAERWGLDGAARLLAANNAGAPVVARPYHVDAAGLRDALGADGVLAEAAPPGAVWPAGSVRLARGAAARDAAAGGGAADGAVPGGGTTLGLTELDAFRRGLFHVQDPASTFVTVYAAFPPGATVADLCAAPGGKALELARTAGRVLAGDRAPARLARVADNVRRVGAPNVLPFVADAARPPLADVDALLVDVPCTGTGTFRRHPDARWRLRPSDLAVLPAEQRAILRAAARCVRPGGLLVYSTCSLEPEENDGPVDAFLAEHPEWAVEPPPAGTVPDAVLDGGRLRVVPHLHGADGAFAARLRRRGGSGAA